MQPEQIDWESGHVVCWDLDFLEPLKPLADQVFNLKEDLAQIRYGDRVLDVGWYPEFSDKGKFVVRVVRGTNWDDPLFQEACDTVPALLSCLKAAITIAKSTASPP